MIATDIDVETLCAVLAGRPVASPLTAEAVESLWDTAVGHRIDLPLAAALRAGAYVLPPRLAPRIEARWADANLRDLLRHRELCRLVEAFDRHGGPLLLLKGAGLAYLVYAETALRPSMDLDLWIRRDDLDAAEAALVDCGYRRLREPDADVATSQRHYGRRDGLEQNHFVDLHWQVANPAVFAEVLTFDSAWQTALRIDALGPAARTLSFTDALLLACVHRVAHHHDADVLQWVWDIHLLVTRLAPPDIDRLVDIARRRRVAAVVARSLALARERFGSDVSDTVLASLAADASEPSARFLHGLSSADEFRSTFTATPHWSARLRLVREHLLPSPAYMRATYASWPAWLLPVAYAHRVLRGAPRWCRRRVL